MTIDNQIKLGEAEVRLQGQLQAKGTAEVQILRAKRDIERFEKTIETLNEEIKKTKDMISNLKGGEK